MSTTQPIATLDDALDTLAETIATLRFAALDELTVTAARQRIFDTLAATTIGLHTPEGEVLRDVGSDPAISQLRHRTAEQIRLYVGATRTTEIDDIDIASSTAVGAVVVPVALALAATHNDDESKLIAAIVAGYEAMIRLSRAIGGATILYRGIWPTHATAAFAAAATAARLRELDAKATAQALALALEGTDVVPASAFARPAARFDALGRAAADGAAAASAAAAGMAAGPNAFESYAERLGVRIEADALMHYKPKSFRIHDVDIKLFPTSREALASIEAFLSLKPDITAPEEIERVIVHVPGTYRDMVDRPSMPSQRIESMIGVQYAMALALLEPEALYDALRKSLRTDARIAQLMEKIDVRASSQLDTFFPQTWGSTVTLHLKHGRVVTQEVLDPVGSRSHMLEWRKLARKVARIFAASGVGNAQFVSRLLERCRVIATGPHDNLAEELLISLQEAGTWSPRRATPKAGDR